MVELEKVTSGEEMDELKSYIQEHQQTTGSKVAEAVLEDWPTKVEHFVKVMPTDYKQVLEQVKSSPISDDGAGADEEEQKRQYS